MIYASYDHNMPTFEVFLVLYTYVPIHGKKKLFSLFTHALKNSFSLYQYGLYIKSLFLFKDFFSPFKYKLIVYIKIFSHIVYIQKFFSHIFYIQKLFSHIVYIQKILFFSLYTYMTFCSQRLFLFLFLALLPRLFILF